MNFLKTFPSVIEKTYSNCKNISLEKNEIIFPLIKLKSFFGDKKIICLPFLDEVNLNEDQIKSFDYFFEKLDKKSTVEIKISGRNKDYPAIKKFLTGKGFKENVVKGHIVTDLTTEEGLWKSFHKHTRNDIRKAEKSGLTLTKVENEKELKNFYKLYLKEMKNFGTPQHSFKFFKNCFFMLKDNFCGFNCYKDRKIIGSIILFLDETHCYVSFNVSNSNYRMYRPNDILYWAAIKECLKRNVKSFDMGQVDLNYIENSREESLLKFKQKWLGEIYKKYHFTFNFEISQKKKDSLKKLRKVWRMLPMPVVKIFGPRVCSRMD